MKKFVYLCGMMLLSMNMMAQIDLNDMNWRNPLHEDFTLLGRTWNSNSFLSSDGYWRGYPGSGVTHGNEKQVYQFTQCHFNDLEETMELVAEFDSAKRIPHNNYYLPSWMWPSNGGDGYPSSDGLYYFSGEIDYVNYNFNTNETEKFLYGYFEIRCKLPAHRGAFPAFWLHGSSKDSLDPYYEEIDIFEYTWSISDPYGWHWNYSNPHPTYAGDPWVISTGIYHNLHGNGCVPNDDAYARNYPRLNGSLDVSGWHTYSCEWMPDHVYWFLDGNLVNSYYDVMHIPRHPMTLKTDYCINRYALENYYDNGQPEWMGRGVMTIDYINVYQLEWDCETDETITCQSDLDGFDFAVKKNISVTSSVVEPIVSSSDKVTFRVTDSFEITGQFQADSGCEFTVIRQNCPE